MTHNYCCTNGNKSMIAIRVPVCKFHRQLLLVWCLVWCPFVAKCIFVIKIHKRNNIYYNVRQVDFYNEEMSLKLSLLLQFIDRYVYGHWLQLFTESFYIVSVSFDAVFVQMLLFDFSHHNIEMACAMLETCGRCLYRTPESHQRVKVYLVSHPT